jgi:hypothetical protein
MYRDLIPYSAYTQTQILRDPFAETTKTLSDKDDALKPWKTVEYDALYDSMPSPEYAAAPGIGPMLNYSDKNEPVATRNSSDSKRGVVAVRSCDDSRTPPPWLRAFDSKPGTTCTQCRICTCGKQASTTWIAGCAANTNRLILPSSHNSDRYI